MLEFRFLFALLARIDQRSAPQTQFVPVDSIINDLGYSYSNASTGKRAICDKLGLPIPPDEEEKRKQRKKRKPNDLKDEEARRNLFNRHGMCMPSGSDQHILETSVGAGSDFLVSNGMIRYRISGAFKDYLCSLEKEFALFPANVAQHISSPFVFKLYLYLHSYSGLKYCAIRLNDLERMLYNHKKSRKEKQLNSDIRLHDFKKTLVDAVDTITTNTDLKIERPVFEDENRNERGAGRKLARDEESKVIFRFKAYEETDTLPRYLDKKTIKQEDAKKRHEAAKATKQMKSNIVTQILNDNLWPVTIEVLEFKAQAAEENALQDQPNQHRKAQKKARPFVIAHRAYQAKADALPYGKGRAYDEIKKALPSDRDTIIALYEILPELIKKMNG